MRSAFILLREHEDHEWLEDERPERSNVRNVLMADFLARNLGAVLRDDRHKLAIEAVEVDVEEQVQGGMAVVAASRADREGIGLMGVGGHDTEGSIE